ncbi:MAG: ATP-binding protein [Pseudomonadota bacterium]
MKSLALKRFTPRSLFGRTALILLVPIVTIQLVVSYVFIQRLYENVTEQMTRSFLAPLRVVTAEIDRAETRAAARGVVDMAQRLLIRVDLDAEPAKEDARLFYDLSGRVVVATLKEGLPAITAIDLANPIDDVQLAIETRHGPVALEFSRDRVSASNPHQLLVLMVFVSAIVTVISFLFLKNQVRPIRRLAQAAAAFGKGRSVAYSPAGATEVRQAGRSFLEMRNRIERHIEQRTLMLSGVSHDLRTPLTRMKLALSLMPDDEEVRALRRDVDEMQRMLDTFLGFARVDATETPELVDPVALADRLVVRASEDGQPVVLETTGEPAKVALRPLGVERALENLIGNAQRYGSRVIVGVSLEADKLRFRVEDDGPGIPEPEREAAIRPFARLDPARNQDRGGSVGLGLSIVRDIAVQHGGALQLDESARLGGLQVDLLLPR